MNRRVRRYNSRSALTNGLFDARFTRGGIELADLTSLKPGCVRLGSAPVEALDGESAPGETIGIIEHELTLDVMPQVGGEMLLGRARILGGCRARTVVNSACNAAKGAARWRPS